MLEKEIEKSLVKAIKARGGCAYKFTSPGTSGMPDRLVLMPGGRCCFVEVKAPGKRPRPLQLKRHEHLRALGFKVYVIDDKSQISSVII